MTPYPSFATLLDNAIYEFELDQNSVLLTPNPDWCRLYVQYKRLVVDVATTKENKTHSFTMKAEDGSINTFFLTAIPSLYD